VTQKRKVCVVITARPSYSRIKTALTAIIEHQDLELQLIVAASALLSRYGSAVEYIENDGFHIDEKVFMVIEGASPTSMAKTTGLGIIELGTAFDNLKPDMVVTIADRFETMATAVAASYMNIPLVHIQGGEVTGSIDEKVRHAITKLADLHLVASDDAKTRLLKMGEHQEAVFVTGCPSIDIADQVYQNPALDYDLNEKYGGVGTDININDDYIVVMQHPVTTEFEASREQIQHTIEAIDRLGIQTFWFWPNVDAGSDGTSSGLRSYREEHPDNKIKFFKNIESDDFLKLLKNALCLIGNSSVGIRECSYLGIPVVNIGTRQNGRQRGKNVRDVAYHDVEIYDAVKYQVSHGHYDKEMIYGNGCSGQIIANILSKAMLDITKVISY